MSYQREFQSALSDPSRFWLEKSRLVDWITAPTRGIDYDASGGERWFCDGQLNTCFNAVDRHVLAGRGEQVAIYYDSPVTNSAEQITYAQLLDAVELFAGALLQRGVQKGDRVVIYMPMVPEAAIAMLACARIGAVHSVVFGGFAANELAARLIDATPSVIVTATGGIEVNRVIPYMPIVNEAITLAHLAPAAVIILDRPQAPYTLGHERECTWQDAMASAKPAPCEVLAATDPLYILYTSGTTGKPKGVVRDNGGHAVALTYSMDAIYDVQAGEVFWAASDVGWVVGHSYIVYAPLFAGCTTVLYEGKPVRTPDAGAFWRVIQDYGVSTLFAAPTAFRAIRKEDPEGAFFARYNTESLQALYLAGERLDPATFEWLAELTDLPIVDHWWQTETGWAIASNPRGIEYFAPKPGSATKCTPGFDVRILRPDGTDASPGEQGAVVIKRPLPPGCLTTIWGNAERLQASYFAPFPGYYLSGDGGFVDDDGYLFIMGRTDDVINVAGHRLSTGEMEEILAGHQAVAECAVIGIADELKGQLPLGLVVLKDGITTNTADIEAELVAAVRHHIGAVASFHRALIVTRLPKTRSGKILRDTLRKMADGLPYTVPSTIEDPSVLDELAADLPLRNETRGTEAAPARD